MGEIIEHAAGPTDDELIAWAGEEQFFLFCDKDDFLQIARAVMQRYAGRSPDVQGEPVAWSGWGCQYPGKMPRLYGDRHIAELNCDRGNGDQVLYFTAAPQPAEQKPASDVSALIDKAEALSFAIAHDLTGRQFNKIAAPFAELQDALAAFRRGGGE